MEKLSLGIIETIGLAAAIVAADTCVKSANVTLVGYELTKGSGMAAVKIEGNVGAVNSAIQAAKAVLKKDEIWSAKVIPRPSEYLECMIRNEETVGYCIENNEDKPIEQKEVALDDTLTQVEEIQESIKDISAEVTNESIKQDHTEDDELEKDRVDSSEEDGFEEVEKNQESNEHEEQNQNDSDQLIIATCNLCKDPKCSRIKGDLRINCIHYDELKMEELR